MRLPRTAHTALPWRMHEYDDGFRVEDVWALPTPGGPDDFGLLLDALTRGDPSRSGSRVVRALFWLRWRLGEQFGWDEAGDAGLAPPTLADRMPSELVDTASGLEFESLPFTPLFLLQDEFAAEIVNRTMHGILHLGWVPDGHGGHRGQLAVLVRPDGWLGRAYMATIRPFRLWLVYPQLLRQIERRWHRAAARTA